MCLYGILIISMKKIILFWLLNGIVCTAYSQTIIIKNSETAAPVESVILVSKNPKASATTNAEGKVDITSFYSSDSIIVSHTLYIEEIYSFTQLETMQFLVALKEKPQSLREVIISSSRWEQKKIETPNRIESISMKEAVFQNPQTAADLLGVSGYAFIQKSQLGGGSPMLRGMATNRVLLVVDGVRMNTAIFRSGNLQNVISLDANAMESTEILFGPGSVMYGSDAVGGIMSFTTLKPRLSGKTNNNPLVTGSAMTRFSTANTESTGHFDFNIGLKKIALTSSFTYSNYGDLRSGSKGGVNYFYRQNFVQTLDNKDYMVPNDDSTLQIGSKYSQVNFMQKIKYKPSNNWDIEYGFHFSETSEYNRYDRLYIMQTDGPYKNKLRWAEWYYGPQQWKMHRLGITHLKNRKLFDRMSLVGAYQLFEESRYDREFMFRELRMQKENVDAYSVNLDLEKYITEQLKVSYGIETVYNKVNSVASFTHVITEKVDSTVTRYPDGSTWQSDGIYITAQYKPHPKWVFSAGIRYNTFLIKADFDTTFFPFPFTSTRMNSGAPCGNLGFVYSPVTSWQIYINGATGFRAPNIDDMGKVFESVPGYLVVPNPDLQPEKVYNVELGTAKTLSSILKVDATVYYTWLNDAMIRKNFVFNGDTTIRYAGNKSRIQAVQNVTKIDVYGFQAGLELFVKGIALKSNISFQDGREQSPDSLIYYPLRHAAPTFGSTHLTYEHKKFKFDFYALYNAKMDYEDLALTERENASYARDEKGLAYVDDWYTLNFKAAYYPNVHVGVTVGLENIEDRMYRPYSSGINAPGRNFIASIRVKF